MTPPHSDPRQRERRLALVLLALFVFCPPVLLLIDRLPSAVGWLPIYLLLTWGAVIGLAAWLAERPKRS
jgi:hypothetical protein